MPASCSATAPVYYAMVPPEEGREAVGRTPWSPYQRWSWRTPLSGPWASTGTPPSWLAEWSVMNLLPDRGGGPSGTLFFSPLSEDNTYGIVYQQVALRPDQGLLNSGAAGELEAFAPPR